MHVPRIDPIHAARRFGAFAVLTLRAIEKIRRGERDATEAAKHFAQVAQTHRLRETGAYDPRLGDMLVAQLRQTRGAPCVGGRRLTGTAQSQGSPYVRFSGRPPTLAAPRLKRAPTAIYGYPCCRWQSLVEHLPYREARMFSLGIPSVADAPHAGGKSAGLAKRTQARRSDFSWSKNPNHFNRDTR